MEVRSLRIDLMPDRQIHAHTDTRTHTQTDRQIHGQTDTQTDRQTNTWTDRQIHGQTDRYTDRHADIKLEIRRASFNQNNKRKQSFARKRKSKI